MKCVSKFFRIAISLSLIGLAGCRTTASSAVDEERYVAFGRLANSNVVFVGAAILGDEGFFRIAISNYPVLARYLLSTTDDIRFGLTSEELDQLTRFKNVPESVVLCGGNVTATENLASTIYRGSMLCQPPDQIFTIGLSRHEGVPIRGRGETEDWTGRLCLTFDATMEEFASWCLDTLRDDVTHAQLVWPEA